jgi:hypothetical protein
MPPPSYNPPNVNRMLILAQGLVEYSTLTSIVGAIQRTWNTTLDWIYQIERVDQRVWLIIGILVVAWLMRRIFLGARI